VLGFHSDNGSEYINKRVADLLEKLLIEFTKSRSRHSNDNALAESKNGAVVRKLFGYSHIPQRWAPLINDFNQQYLNPYLNFHRPCFHGFPWECVKLSCTNLSRINEDKPCALYDVLFEKLLGRCYRLWL
jgi:transposase InsO family protein